MRGSALDRRGRQIELGLRANLAQFSLLVAVNALVGATLGQERTVVPLLAQDTFVLARLTAALAFIVAFRTVKAATNFFAGTLSDRFGRKPVLVARWLVAIPGAVPADHGDSPVGRLPTLAARAGLNNHFVAKLTALQSNARPTWRAHPHS